MTDYEDRTQHQADYATKPSPDAPRGKWKWQRAMAAGSFLCGALFPVFVMLANDEQAKTMTDLAVHWYLFHGAVVGAWFGGSTFSAMKR